MFRSVALCLAFLLQGPASSPAGQSLRKLDNGVSVRVDSLTVRLLVCGERTFRITAFRDGFMASQSSLVVTRKWAPVRWRQTVRDSMLLISARRASARINLNTGSISFSNDR